MKVAFLSRMRERRLFLFLSSGGCKSAGTGRQKNKHLPRNDTEKHGRKNKQKQKLATELHGNKTKQKHLTRKQNTAFRAGCVSDGCIHFFPMITLL